jgi:hypothetical protein
LAGIHAKLFGNNGLRLVVNAQRIRLPTGPAECNDQVLVECLAPWVFFN